MELRCGPAVDAAAMADTRAFSSGAVVHTYHPA